MPLDNSNFRIIKILLAVGDKLQDADDDNNNNNKIASLSKKRIQRVSKAMKSSEVAKFRFHIYFADSLAKRLLFELSAHTVSLPQLHFGVE